MAEILRQVKISLLLLLLLTFLTGFLYPSVITLFAQAFFPWRANGSLLKVNNEVIGSKWIGQQFGAPEYFWGRPSATPFFPYNGTYSSGSNFAASNLNYLAVIVERIAVLKAANPKQAHNFIPIDLVTASGSGLDPDISPLAAHYQAERVSEVRGFSVNVIKALIDNSTSKRTLYFMGEQRVNVLKLNLALDNLTALRGQNGNGTTRP